MHHTQVLQLLAIRNQLSEVNRYRSYQTEGIVLDIDRLLAKHIEEISSPPKATNEPNDESPF